MSDDCSCARGMPHGCTSPGLCSTSSVTAASCNEHRTPGYCPSAGEPGPFATTCRAPGEGSGAILTAVDTRQTVSAAGIEEVVHRARGQHAELQGRRGRSEKCYRHILLLTRWFGTFPVTSPDVLLSFTQK